LRIKLVLAYDGTTYHGWQIQKKGPTIQQMLEDSLVRICNRHIRIHAAGRTDAGVHALGQVAHFDPPPKNTGISWQQALNSLLASSIRIVRYQQVTESFHARFSARVKHYSYSFWTEKFFVYPQRRNFVWHTGPLNLEAMSTAADHLVGRHDFCSFMNKGTETRDTVRHVWNINFRQGCFPQETVMHIRADGFLKQMVRNIAGALVQVGRGKLRPQEMEKILQHRDRSLAPATAPARGLCLEAVEY